jgi:hypothetical protein
MLSLGLTRRFSNILGKFATINPKDLGNGKSAKIHNFGRQPDNP